jgi:radical SAM protein with 4Fe4S-binding SPASM domain
LTGGGGGIDLISISRLLCDEASPGDSLRYAKKENPRPVVVWNCTRRCNLDCLHCYASANSHSSPEELSTEAGKKFIQDLSEFGVPVILFSGGEPLLRKDLFELAKYAKNLGLRVALSTNGTLLTPENARELKNIGFAEVGISLDGLGGSNDYFRGKEGAFQAALTGIRYSKAEGLRVSLRLTITRFNYQEIPAILDLVEEEKIERVCLYHLAYSGRGQSLRNNDIDHNQTRDVLDVICERTLDFYRRGLRKEILTVGNHADGVYLYLKAKAENPTRAAIIMDLLKLNGGNNTGIKIGAVDNLGNVHPDQFWWHHTLGNVTTRKFGEIWLDTSQPLLKGLKDRQKLLHGRCGHCRYLDICNGNLRVRAEAVFNDVWADDPACYLTDQEIGIE